MKSVIGFRVDSSDKIGSGHIVRCLTLANELKQRGYDCVFLARVLSETSLKSIKIAGHKIFKLPVWAEESAVAGYLMHGDFLQVSQEVDAQDSLRVLAQIEGLSHLFVDHYGIYEPWDQKIRSLGVPLIKIDDLADRKHDCDVLIDQNFYQNKDVRYIQKVPDHCRKLLGPEYALLRPEFQGGRGISLREKKSFKTALISFGGFDRFGYCLKVAEILLKETSFHVVVLGSPREQDQDSWGRLRQQFSSRVNGPKFSHNPVEDMISADIYVGAGGTITWERLALGLSGVVFSVAQNQVETSQSLGVAGYQIYGGPMSCLETKTFLNQLASYQKLQETPGFSERLTNLVDGKGVQRVLSQILDSRSF